MRRLATSSKTSTVRRIPALLGLFVALGVATGLGAQERRTLALALGGGSARGIAHVGVLRWLEEHHVPVDAIAGTSMGGLVGGAYAAGMSSAELTKLLETTGWDDVFGATAYRYKSIRRKQDARDYPSRLEFNLRRGFAFPTALNSGAEIDLLLSRIAAMYGGLSSFDSLPTPFRCVAMELRTGTAVVLDSGSLPLAMRATMSLPAVFPPVRIGNQQLVDGGPMNNVPADVARAMGVDVVIAVAVGSESDTTDVQVSLFGVVGAVSDALIRANTKRGIATADMIVRPDLRSYGALDYDRSHELIAAGYAAAERVRDKLLPFAVDSQTWRAYIEARAARRAHWPRVDRIRVEGMTRDDARWVDRLLRKQVGRPLDVTVVESTIRRLSGRDRYLSVTWDLVRRDKGADLVVRAAPYVVQPILMATVNAENRTSNDYVFQLAARALAYDTPFAGDELRLDGGIGTNPRVAAELLHHLIAPGSTSLFAAATGGWSSHEYDVVQGDAIFAQYTQKLLFAQADLGLERPNLELRTGIGGGHVDGHLDVGDPGLPSLSGNLGEVRVRGIFDDQNSPTVPSAGLRVFALGRHVLAYPDPVTTLADRTNRNLNQAELAVSNVWSWGERRNRLFLVGFGGSSFGKHPLLTDQFTLGMPLRLDAFAVGQRRGDDYGVMSAGYLRQLTRFPSVLGGSIYGGAWVETGSAWDQGMDPSVVGQGAVGAVLETLVGPVVVRYSVGGGGRRFALGIGRLF